MRRKSEFGTWLEKYPGRGERAGLNPSTIDSILSKLQRIETKEHVDLDNQFEIDGLKSLIARFKDGNEHKLTPTASASIRNHLNKYKQFCEEHPPK